MMRDGGGQSCALTVYVVVSERKAAYEVPVTGKGRISVRGRARGWKGTWGSEAQTCIGEEGRKDGQTIV